MIRTKYPTIIKLYILISLIYLYEVFGFHFDSPPHCILIITLRKCLSVDEWPRIYDSETTKCPRGFVDRRGRLVRDEFLETIRVWVPFENSRRASPAWRRWRVRVERFGRISRSSSRASFVRRVRRVARVVASFVPRRVARVVPRRLAEVVERIYVSVKGFCSLMTRIWSMLLRWRSAHSLRLKLFEAEIWSTRRSTSTSTTAS